METLGSILGETTPYGMNTPISTRSRVSSATDLAREQVHNDLMGPSSPVKIRRQGSDKEKSRISYFHPQTTAIRARIPTPRGPQPKIEEFTATAGLAVQLSASVSSSPVERRCLSNGFLRPPRQDHGLRGSVRRIMSSFGKGGKRGGGSRRRSLAMDDLLSAPVPSLPEITYSNDFSATALGTQLMAVQERLAEENLDKTTDENKSIVKEAEVSFEQTKPVIFSENEPHQDQSVHDETFDTDAAIAKIQSMVEASAAELESAAGCGAVSEGQTLWRRMSLRSQRAQIQNRDPSPIKFSLPSPTMLNVLDQTKEFVNIPVATTSESDKRSESSPGSNQSSEDDYYTVSHISEDDDIPKNEKRNDAIKTDKDLMMKRSKLQLNEIFQRASQTIRHRGSHWRRQNTENMDAANNESKSVSDSGSESSSERKDFTDLDKLFKLNEKSIFKKISSRVKELYHSANNTHNNLPKLLTQAPTNTSEKKKSDTGLRLDTSFATIADSDQKRVLHQGIHKPCIGRGSDSDNVGSNDKTCSTASSSTATPTSPVESECSEFTKNVIAEVLPFPYSPLSDSDTCVASSPETPLSAISMTSSKKGNTVRFREFVQVMGDEKETLVPIESPVKAEIPIMRDTALSDLVNGMVGFNGTYRSNSMIVLRSKPSVTSLIDSPRTI
ncbi:hypothetical protein V1511DRAFT_495545 [Dipodascopsis uninucleata]